MNFIKSVKQDVQNLCVNACSVAGNVMSRGVVETYKDIRGGSIAQTVSKEAMGILVALVLIALIPFIGYKITAAFEKDSGLANSPWSKGETAGSIWSNASSIIGIALFMGFVAIIVAAVHQFSKQTGTEQR